MAAKEERRRTARGKYTVKRNEGHVPHDEGFRRALDAALKNTRWPAGSYRNVRVEFSINIEVVNPGNVIDYVATLTSGG